MITDEQLDILVERFVRRIEQANVVFLKDIGTSIKKLGKLKPTEAHQLVQMLKYGGNYDEIVKQISKYTNLNIKEIEKIFKEYAKKDQTFYEKFYKYRNIPYVPFDENDALKKQTRALYNIAKNEMYDFTRKNVIGYTINGKFYNMRQTYNAILDEAVVNVGQGKETFDSAMSNILKQIGESGIKTINYESGRAVRLDSAVRMHLKSRLRE